MDSCVLNMFTCKCNNHSNSEPVFIDSPVCEAGYADEKSKQKVLEFHYIKNQSYRSYYVDGVFGGLTPKGKLSMQFFLEILYLELFYFILVSFLLVF